MRPSYEGTDSYTLVLRGDILHSSSCIITQAKAC